MGSFGVRTMKLNLTYIQEFLIVYGGVAAGEETSLEQSHCMYVMIVIIFFPITSRDIDSSFVLSKNVL